MLRPTLIVVFDAVKDSITVVTPVRPEAGVDARAALARATERLSAVVDALDKPLDKSLAEYDEGPLEVPPQSNTTPAEYKAMVARAKDYIAAGDIFQVVLSQRFEAPFPLPAFSLYRALRRVNPSPYLFFTRTPGFEVVGASPELLVQVVGDHMATHPIAGTRPRGATPADDDRLADELSRDPKGRAEHVMLVDLGRNDLGRVARPGTVSTSQYMEVERYSHVLHLVSHVEARLRPELDALDALRSVFPAGTLSGAPKIRAMQLIAAAEGERRGLYGGAVGYLGYDGNLDTAITIRSAVLKDGLAHVHTGAGIVARSQPESEFQETEHKAAALRRAIELAAAPPPRRPVTADEGPAPEGAAS
jgi:anthranilate synthase component 1